MELSVLERLLLLNHLPQQGDITTLRIVQKLREDLSFTEDEHSLLKIEQTGDQIKWDTQAQQNKMISIGPKALVAIRTCLQKLSDKGEANVTHLSLFDKFLPDETE